MTREMIGFIGLGNIGTPMADHIAGAGFEMTATCRSCSPARPSAEQQYPRR